MGSRRIRREQRQADMKESRLINGFLKVKERARRDDRVVKIIKKGGQLPYAPFVMSWLSEKLDKPSRLITAEDVKKVL
jgi:hypothetical protein